MPFHDLWLIPLLYKSGNLNFNFHDFPGSVRTCFDDSTSYLYSGTSSSVPPAAPSSSSLRDISCPTSHSSLDTGLCRSVSLSGLMSDGPAASVSEFIPSPAAVSELAVVSSGRWFCPCSPQQRWFYLARHIMSRISIFVSVHNRCKALKHIVQSNQRVVDWLIEHGLTSPPTQYRLYGRRFFLQVKDITNYIKVLKAKATKETNKYSKLLCTTNLCVYFYGSQCSSWYR